MRFRSDRSELQSDGARVWYADWIGGPTIAKVENCRLENLAGDMRRTVRVTGDADYFSIPAECTIQGCRVKGYLTTDSETVDLVFRQVYY